MIDRPLRPLFPEGYACETQVIGLLLSADLENDSDTLAIIGASTALYISDIPFENPVGAVRVGYWDDQVRGEPVHRRPQDEEQAQPARGRHRGRDRDGGVGRPGDHRGGHGPGPHRGARGDQEDRGPPEGAPEPRGQAEAGGREEGARSRARRRDRERDGGPRCYEAMRKHGQARDVRADEGGQGRLRRLHPRGPAREEGGGQRRLRRPPREDPAPARSSATAGASTAAASTRSGPSRPRWACCPAPTARRSSRAARRRPWSR